jgi:WD40 repeat protein
MLSVKLQPNVPNCNKNMKNRNQNRFVGHKDIIACLGTNPDSENMVVTGSADKTVRLWDARTFRTSKCFTSPSFTRNISSVAMIENDLYVADDRSVYLFDIRGDLVLVREPSAVISNVTNEEINSLHIYSRMKLIGLTDDSGNITFIDCNHPNNIIKLPKVHNNIVGSLSFQNKYDIITDTFQFVTGGFDSKLCIHSCSNDILLSHSVKQTLNFNQAFLNQQTNIQMINPPFVQSLHYLYHGSLLACGLGDGSVSIYIIYTHISIELISTRLNCYYVQLRIFEAENILSGTIMEIPDAHNGMITSMHVANSGSSSHIINDNLVDNFIVTGGKFYSLSFIILYL